MMATKGGVVAVTTQRQVRLGAQSNRRALLPPKTEQVEEEEKGNGDRAFNVRALARGSVSGGAGVSL